MDTRTQENPRTKSSRDLLRLIKYYNEATEEEREELLLYVACKKMLKPRDVREACKNQEEIAAIFLK